MKTMHTVLNQLAIAGTITVLALARCAPAFSANLQMSGQRGHAVGQM